MNYRNTKYIPELGLNVAIDENDYMVIFANELFNFDFDKIEYKHKFNNFNLVPKEAILVENYFINLCEKMYKL